MIVITTCFSSIAFSISCFAIYLDLDCFYNVDPKYKERVGIFVGGKLKLVEKGCFIHGYNTGYQAGLQHHVHLLLRVSHQNENVGFWTVPNT
jgi:hypothetical protein